MELWFVTNLQCSPGSLLKFMVFNLTVCTNTERLEWNSAGVWSKS